MQEVAAIMVVFVCLIGAAVFGGYLGMTAFARSFAQRLKTKVDALPEAERIVVEMALREMLR